MKLKKIRKAGLRNVQNDQSSINPEFEDLFELSSDREKDLHEARMIMFRFLSEIERLNNNERGIKKKIASSIKRSQSFVSQLFNGDKIINLITLARIQRSFKIKYKIVACPENQFNSEIFDYHSLNISVIENNIYLDSEQPYLLTNELFIKLLTNTNCHNDMIDVDSGNSFTYTHNLTNLFIQSKNND